MARSTRDTPRLLFLTLVSGVTLTLGCTRRGDISLPRAASRASGPATVEKTVPTASQAERWGNDFVTALAADDIAAANAMIDWDEIFDTATRDLGAPEPIRGQFIARARQSAARSGLVSQLARAEQAGGDVSLVRCRADADECHAVLRVVRETGLNYYDARLLRRDGVVRAADIDIYLAGQPVSATLRRYFLMAAAKQSPPVLQNLSGLDGELFRHADDLEALFTAADASDHAGVLDVVRGLSPALQRDKAILLVRTIAAAQVDQEDHARSIGELRAAFPDDPCLQLVAIDHHSLRREHEACLAAIDRLDRQVGGDPYLDVLRASACLGARDHAGAIRYVEKAIAAMPDLIQPYWIRVAIALDQQNHDDTATWLDTIAKRFNVPVSGVEDVPEYAEFVKSPQHREWKARRNR